MSVAPQQSHASPLARPAAPRARTAWRSAAAAAALLVLAPAGACAKALKATAPDPAGDAATSASDILQATASYTSSSGALRVTLKTSRELNLRVKNQLVFTFTGKACANDMFGASAVLTDATAPWAYSLAKKSTSTTNGSGTVSGTTYAATFKSKLIAKKKPVSFQAAIFAPGTNGALLDQTDCVGLK